MSLDSRTGLMNLIVERSPSIKWYTNLFPFFGEIEPVIRSYSWLWSNIDLHSRAPPVPENQTGVIWISGDALFDFTTTRPQFVWSVLSAIPQQVVETAKAVDCIPYADGNPTFWIGSPVPQHPNADFEIVCWDATATMVIGVDNTIGDAFRRAYPDVRDLDAENLSRRNPLAT